MVLHRHVVGKKLQMSQLGRKEEISGHSPLSGHEKDRVKHSGVDLGGWSRSNIESSRVLRLRQNASTGRETILHDLHRAAIVRSSDWLSRAPA